MISHMTQLLFVPPEKNMIEQQCVQLLLLEKSQLVLVEVIQTVEPILRSANVRISSSRGGIGNFFPSTRQRHKVNISNIDLMAFPNHANK